MSFGDDIIEQGDVRHYGLHIGTVIKRDDPEKLGRVQIRIPGLIDGGSSPWAWPLTIGGGNRNQGMFFIPEVGSEIGVWFKLGRIQHPYYMAAQWGHPRTSDSEVPPEASLESPDNRVISTPTFYIEMNETKEENVVRIACRKNGDFIEIDANRNTVTIKGTTSVIIQAEGLLSLNGLQVQINDRLVLDNKDPI